MKRPTPLTPKRRERFLQVLSAGGTVKDAAASVGICRESVYAVRDADPEFRAAWELALDDGTEVLEAEAKRRAVDGVDEPVYQGKELIGFVRKYSDTLLMFLLKSRDREKYSDRVDIRIQIDRERQRVREEAEAQGLDADLAIAEFERILAAGAKS